jgi:hypothetical protein
MHFIERFDENRLVPPGPKYPDFSEGYSLLPLVEGTLDGKPYPAKAGDVL